MQVNCRKGLQLLTAAAACLQAEFASGSPCQANKQRPTRAADTCSQFMQKYACTHLNIVLLDLASQLKHFDLPNASAFSVLQACLLICRARL